MSKKLRDISAPLIAIAGCLAIFLAIAPHQALANSSTNGGVAQQTDCSLTNPPTCAYVSRGQTTSIVPTAFRPSQTTCIQVQNTCASDIMVPTASDAEWDAGNGDFIDKHEACAILSPCSPLAVTLTAAPTSIIAGGSTTLSWTVTGNIGATTCMGSSTDTPSTWSQTYSYANGISPTGTATVTPAPGAGTSTTYTLSCTDSIHTGSGNTTIHVAAVAANASCSYSLGASCTGGTPISTVTSNFQIAGSYTLPTDSASVVAANEASSAYSRSACVAAGGNCQQMSSVSTGTNSSGYPTTAETFTCYQNATGTTGTYSATGTGNFQSASTCPAYPGVFNYCGLGATNLSQGCAATAAANGALPLSIEGANGYAANETNVPCEFIGSYGSSGAFNAGVNVNYGVVSGTYYYQCLVPTGTFSYCGNILLTTTGATGAGATSTTVALATTMNGCASAATAISVPSIGYSPASATGSNNMANYSYSYTGIFTNISAGQSAANFNAACVTPGQYMYASDANGPAANAANGGTTYSLYDVYKCQ